MTAEQINVELLDACQIARNWVSQFEALPDHAAAAKSLLRVLDAAIALAKQEAAEAE